MEYSIEISNEVVYHPLHEELYPFWNALVTAHNYFIDAEEVIRMKESYIQMRLQMEQVLWEDRTSSWEEDYEAAERDAWSA